MKNQDSDISARPRMRRLVRDWRAWVAALVLLYTLTGFVIVPLVAKNQIPKQVQKLLGWRCKLALDGTD